MSDGGVSRPDYSGGGRHDQKQHPVAQLCVRGRQDQTGGGGEEWWIREFDPDRGAGPGVPLRCGGKILEHLTETLS